MNWVEVIGYVASALIVVSLSMRSIVRLRTVSLVGSLVFVAYGLLIGAWPVVVSNALIAGINVLHLSRELTAGRDDRFSVVPIAHDAPFLTDFLRAFATDIERSQPGWAEGPGVRPDDLVLLVNRDGLPAGVLVGEPQGPELRVRLDYVTPAHRDTRIARWAFGAGAKAFTAAGFRRLVAEARTPQHASYLRAVGFHPEGGLWALDLPDA